MASVIQVAPWALGLERHRTLLFVASAVLLALNYWLVIVRPRACAPGELCHVDAPFTRFNRRLYWASVAVFVAALLATYGSLLVLQWM